MLKLKLGEIPLYPFLKKSFKIDVNLADEYDQIRSGEELRLQVNAYLDEGDGSPSEQVNNIMDIEENSGIQKNGAAKVVVKFNEVSANFERKKFIIVVQAVHPTIRIAPASTQPMYVVRYKLHVMESNSRPYVWYKDEGGKDKCIEIKVSIQDANAKTIRDKKVPIRVVLNYSNGQRVKEQNILGISPDSRPFIDDHSDAIVKLRINEVSNRHRGQLFQIEVCPDIVSSPQSADISSAFCVPVDVKSKRNTTSKLKHPDQPFKKFKSAQESSLSRPTSINSMAPLHVSGAGGSRDPSTVFIGTGNHPSIGASVNNIVNWATTIMKGIDAIQWREIGFEQNPDGTPNLSRPLYSIPNPNGILADIVDHLRHLQAAAEVERDEPLPFEGIDDDNENGIGTAKLSTDESNAFDLLVTSRAIPESGNYVSHGHDALYVDTGGLQPPQRSRNNSLFLDGINTQVVPTPTFISSFSTTWGNYENLFDKVGSDGSLESQVSYIFAAAIVLKGSAGMPAFNSNKEMLGIYREYLGPAQSTSAHFCSLNLLNVSREEVQVTDVTSRFEEALASQAKSVFLLTDYQNIEKMKEDALIYSYEHESRV